MRINFMVYTHLEEVVSGYAARKVASILRGSGVEVKILCLPKKNKLQNLLMELGEGKIKKEEVLRGFEEFQKEHQSLLENMPGHVIDFHNTPLHSLWPEGFSALESTPIKMILLGLEKSDSFPFLLDEDYAKNGRLAGALELPAIFKRLPTITDARVRKGWKIIKKWTDSDRMPFSDLIFEFNFASRLQVTPIHDNKEFLSQKLFLHLAAEIKRLINEEEDFARKHPREAGEPHRLIDPLREELNRQEEKEEIDKLCSLLGVESLPVASEDLTELVRNRLVALEEHLDKLNAQVRELLNKTPKKILKEREDVCSIRMSIIDLLKKIKK